VAKPVGLAQPAGWGWLTPITVYFFATGDFCFGFRDRVESMVSSLSGCRDRRLRVYVAALEMIQSPTPEPGIVHNELSDYEWTAIKPMQRFKIEMD
jgi:hypothetical protein